MLLKYFFYGRFFDIKGDPLEVLGVYRIALLTGISLVLINCLFFRAPSFNDMRNYINEILLSKAPLLISMFFAVSKKDNGG